MTKINQDIVNKIIFLKSKSKKIEDIAKILNISARSVQKYSVKFPHPNRRSQKTIPEIAESLSCEKSEMLGYLASEGCEYETETEYNEFDYRRNRTYRRKKVRTVIEFSNEDIAIQKRFQLLMKNIFDYNANFDKKGSLKILRKQVIRNLNAYMKFGSHNWKVPEDILKSNNSSFKRMFCRAFCDGDGTVEMKKKEVRIDSINGAGLGQLQSLFSDLNINSKLYHFSSRYRLVIRDIVKFKKTVDFLHPEKNKKLIYIISIKTPREGISQSMQKQAMF